MRLRAVLPPEMPPKAHLKYKGITNKTVRCYKKEINRFFLYLEGEGMPLPQTVSQLDYWLGEFINYLYQSGDSLTQAGWVLSGFKRFMPQLKHALPCAQQYYGNRVRDHIPTRALPLPWQVVQAMAACAWQAKHHDVALLLLLGFTFYLRTMEMLSLKVEDVIFSPRNHQVVITLAQTKTSRQFTQRVVLRHRGLVAICQEAFLFLPAQGPIWRHSAATFRRCFQSLLSHLHLGDYGFSAYSIRRGGATHFYVTTRDLNYVAIQGRWKDLRTARIYLDDSRASLLKLSFPPPLLDRLASLSSFWYRFR